MAKHNTYTYIPKIHKDSPELAVHNYIYDLPDSDFIAVMLKRTAVFTQATTPLSPFIRTGLSHDIIYMHQTVKYLLYVLHKLKVRPSL